MGAAAAQIDFFKDEIKWIGQHSVATLEAYEASSRAGRGDARMLRSQRALMWEVYNAYLRLRTPEGFLYDLEDIAGAVERAFDTDTSERLYRNVIIDEGQDLSPAMLRALAKAVPRGGSLTFFGDVAQQIYGHRMSWKSAGLKPAKIWMFEQNYRNTGAIADLALAISTMPYYAEAAADLVRPQHPVAEGPKPTLVSFADPAAEVDFLVQRAPVLARGRSVAILTRTREQARRLQDRIAGSVQELNRKLTRWSGGAGLSIGTLHAGKGLEFDVVILPFLSDGEFPNPATIEAVGLEDATAGDGRLLYVGVTRARKELLLTHSGQRTRLLPADPALYTSLTR
ncbi:3'-5' exonuclease [Sphingomonas sp. So64.6b]|uniref:3'-5' exonuclease n=1 Tax=Sphingomonas sp. So64.6b TaxID=2997354 RepID=UPI001FCEB8D9|nr:3'-5' exonuclease [Sphingomonas sp. So64.6b]